MSRWFRFYDDALNDPKVQKLPSDMFKAWVNLLCIASKNDGAIPRDDVTFLLRVSDECAKGIIEYLIDRNLLEDRGDVVVPHNWDGRQFKSDNSDPTNAERQKRHRNAKRNAHVTDDRNGSNAVTVTATRAETETEQRIDSASASIHAEFLKLVGSDHDDPNLFGSLYGIQGLVARGFTRETILAGAAGGMRGKARPPNWNYFAKCIESENEQRSAPAKKEIANANSGNILASADRLLERMQQFDEPSGLRGGEGAAVVRLLPEGRR